MTHFWFVPDNPPEKTDFIIVLSYGLDKNKNLTPMTLAAIEKSIELWKKNPQAKIIMSTGDNQRLGVTNAEKMTEYALDLGVPKENLIKEEISSNTYENLVESFKIAKNLGFDLTKSPPTLVTFSLHTKRALLTAKKLGIKPFNLSAYSSKIKPGSRKIWHFSRSSILVYEILSTIYSLFIGWI